MSQEITQIMTGRIKSWAQVKRRMLMLINKNQPVPAPRFTAMISVLTGLRNETVIRYLKELETAGLVRVNAKGELQVEEAAETLLGFE